MISLDSFPKQLLGLSSAVCWNWVAFVKDEMQKGNQRQTIDGIFHVPLPLHLGGVCDWVTKQSKRAQQQVHESIVFIAFCFTIKCIEDQLGQAVFWTLQRLPYQINAINFQPSFLSNAFG